MRENVMNMVEGRKKSRTFRRTQYRTPGNQLRGRYTKPNTGPSVCGSCGTNLAGVPRSIEGKAKTQRRPERPYGGVLCSPCTRTLIRQKALDAVLEVAQ